MMILYTPCAGHIDPADLRDLLTEDVAGEWPSGVLDDHDWNVPDGTIAMCATP